MKRTISILLAALVLLVALPAFAEGEDTLQPGLYIVEGGTDVLYLDELGGGVLNMGTRTENRGPFLKNFLCCRSSSSGRGT